VGFFLIIFFSWRSPSLPCAILTKEVIEESSLLTPPLTVPSPVEFPVVPIRKYAWIVCASITALQVLFSPSMVENFPPTVNWFKGRNTSPSSPTFSSFHLCPLFSFLRLFDVWQHPVFFILWKVLTSVCLKARSVSGVFFSFFLGGPLNLQQHGTCQGGNFPPALP